MTLDPLNCYQALRTRDARFDGVFFTGVATTGIYCRPVCPARTPRESSCQFFPSAAAAEAAGFRPCLRCRPERAPGRAPCDLRASIAERALAEIARDPLGETPVAELAHRLGVGERQLRRILVSEYGASPIELAQTQRLQLAKALLHESGLSVTEIALASGFASLRRFHAAFRAHYGLAPGELQRSAAGRAGEIRLRLAFRPPYARASMLGYLGARHCPGLDAIEADGYARGVVLNGRTGWLSVRFLDGRDEIEVRAAHELLPVLRELVSRVRHMFDLDAMPQQIDDVLSADPSLASRVAERPGLRLPGAFAGEELAVRAMLGQQVSVAAANTLMRRLVERFGRPLGDNPFGLTRAGIDLDALSAASVDSLRELGLTGARALALHGLAAWLQRQSQPLHRHEPEALRTELLTLPGIGPWTVEYILLRALRWPDAFPSSDLGLRRAIDPNAMPSAQELERMSLAWRPWRAYAAIHLWLSDTAAVQRNNGTRP